MLYAEGVDWSDSSQVRRALLVFGDFIRAYRDPGDQSTPKWLDDIRVRLERDGFALDREGRISWSNPPVLVRDLSDKYVATPLLTRWVQTPVPHAVGGWIEASLRCAGPRGRSHRRVAAR